MRALILSFLGIYLWVSFAGAQDVVADVHRSDPDRRAVDNAKSCISLASLGMTSLNGKTNSEEFLGTLGVSAVEGDTEQKMDMPGMDTQDAHTQDRHTQGMGMPGMDMSREKMALMPGMLTPEQMEALRKAKGPEFDRLFLTVMMQHHNGALTMVKDLFDTAGAGQDADLFNFATDVDNTQRAEIQIMQTMLEKKPFEEKR